jgi:hypothetical protein
MKQTCRAVSSAEAEDRKGRKGLGLNLKSLCLCTTLWEFDLLLRGFVSDAVGIVSLTSIRRYATRRYDGGLWLRLCRAVFFVAFFSMFSVSVLPFPGHYGVAGDLGDIHESTSSPVWQEARPSAE